MSLEEAFEILEISQNDLELLKEQYRWFVWFYHPDNKITGGNSTELIKIITAYNYIKQNLSY